MLSGIVMSSEIIQIAQILLEKTKKMKFNKIAHKNKKNHRFLQPICSLSINRYLLLPSELRVHSIICLSNAIVYNSTVKNDEYQMYLNIIELFGQ